MPACLNLRPCQVGWCKARTRLGSPQGCIKRTGFGVRDRSLNRFVLIRPSCLALQGRHARWHRGGRIIFSLAAFACSCDVCLNRTVCPLKRTTGHRLCTAVAWNQLNWLCNPPDIAGDQGMESASAPGNPLLDHIHLLTPAQDKSARLARIRMMRTSSR